MIFATILVVGSLMSFISALAIFSSFVIAGRSRETACWDSNVESPYEVVSPRQSRFDEKVLKRLADSI